MKKNKSRALTKPEASKERKKKLHKTTLSLIEIQNLPKKMVFLPFKFYLL